jgi:1-deoxy-D-xylulose-5-phosphate reductoisomerase
MAVTPLTQDAPRRISILGSTGSVGCSTIDLIAREPERFQVEAITAHSNVDKLAQQARELKARAAVIADPARYSALKDALAGTGIAASAGPAAVEEAASRPSDLVMAAIVGAAGLAPTMAAVLAGRSVVLANKECLVCAGVAASMVAISALRNGPPDAVRMILSTRSACAKSNT